MITMKYISAKSVLLYVFLCFTALYYLFRFALGLGNLAIAIQIGALCGLSIYGLMHITALKKQMPAYFYLSFLYAIILLTPGGLQGGIDAVLYGVKDYVLPISLLLSFWFLFNNRPILIERAFCTVFILGFIVSLIYLLESINVNALGGDFFHYTYKIKDLGLENELINHTGLTPGMLVTLGEQKILKLSDFADLSSDELTGAYDIVKGERVKIKGYLEDFALSKKEADELIMSAREKIYKD